MGNTLTRFVVRPGSRGVKRKREDVVDNSSDEEEELSDTEPKVAKRKSHLVDINACTKKHMKSTSKYIYETLFVRGENSDVTIKALGKDWQLHRHYLKQSGYFTGMFSGSWIESTQDVIQLDIPDHNIDEKALQTAFGCLYKDDVVLKPADVIGVLAAATLLQLDGLTGQCSSFMKETVGVETVVTYMTASQMYCLPEISSFCREWLLHNLMLPCNLAVLKDISCELMSAMIASGDLWVLQVEMDLYTLLKKWIFLRQNPSWKGRRAQLLMDADNYFKQATVKEFYLESNDGQGYIQCFECLRWQYVLNDISSLRLLETDRIVPRDWLDPVYRFQWHRLLHVEQGIDTGPQEVEEQLFHSQAMRCGRVLPADQEFCWRWVGYSYGIDSLITYKSRLVTLMRNNSTSLSYPGSVSLQPKRFMHIRLTASNINETGIITISKSSGIKKICLERNESVVLLTLDQSFKFPLYITVSTLLTSPQPDLPVPRLRVLLRNNAGSQTRKSASPKRILVTNTGETDTSMGAMESLDGESTGNISITTAGTDTVLTSHAENLLAYLQKRQGSS